jgi:hypothetical protein
MQRSQCMEGTAPLRKQARKIFVKKKAHRI